MSKYHTYDECRLYSREAVLAMLAAWGFPAERVEEGQDLPLFGYHGDRRPEVAAIVVRRRHVGPASNDLGFAFRRDAEGRGYYAPVVSEYDAAVLGRRLAAIPGQTVAAKIAASYQEAAARRHAERLERQLLRRVTVEKIVVGGRQRIELRW